MPAIGMAKNKNPLLFDYETFSLLWTQGQTDCEFLDNSIQSRSLFPKLVPIDFAHSKIVLLSSLMNKNKPTHSISDLLIGKG